MGILTLTLRAKGRQQPHPRTAGSQQEPESDTGAAARPTEPAPGPLLLRPHLCAPHLSPGRSPGGLGLAQGHSPTMPVPCRFWAPRPPRPPCSQSRAWASPSPSRALTYHDCSGRRRHGVQSGCWHPLSGGGVKPCCLPIWARTAQISARRQTGPLPIPRGLCSAPSGAWGLGAVGESASRTDLRPLSTASPVPCTAPGHP